MHTIFSYLKNQIFLVCILLLSMIGFFISAEFELFEEFFEFSREHEDLELDEVFSFFVIAATF